MCSESSRTLPTFDKSCTSPEDCAIGYHMAGCCGEVYAMGMNKDEYNRFSNAEAHCRYKAPALCDCVPMETATEDGNVPVGQENTIKLECRMQKCMAVAP
jgi:hypothetical protein